MSFLRPPDGPLSRYNRAVNPQPLIAAGDLASRLQHPDCVVVDCRFDLKAPHRGFQRYLDGHVPGARYAHLDKDLAGAVSTTTGRHPLPTGEAFAACLGAWGVRETTYVVAYDDAGGAIAARLWWLMRFVGHAAAAVLDGGIAAWQAHGGALEARIPCWSGSRYAPGPAAETWVVATRTLEDELAKGAVLLDARAAERYRGTREPIDPVAGHVPGAVNLPFSALLDADQRFLPPAEIQARFDARGAGRQRRGDLIAMCGSGVTACHLLLALEVAGLPRGKLYAGSWSEWIRDPARPIATA